MTRIVAGSAKGRRIAVPASGTRPTSGRVREALFSSLDHLGYVAGRAVADIYAGSGALGLEAASRGAAYVECVEASSRAAGIIRTNARSLGLDVTVASLKAEVWVARPPRRAFDLALLDPPYDLPEERLTRVLAGLARHMDTGGLVVVERSKRSPQPSWPEGLEPAGQRAFSDTLLWMASPARLDA
ncbi:MAG: RsmD family RNA methyltransferase [Actinomycetaceae bacterium]|nr:RsmD family RNA methyltransferase [Actinomycetaceae bacterium]